MTKELYVVDTSALFPNGGKRTSHWKLNDFERGLCTLEEIAPLLETEAIYCVPQVLEELDASKRCIRARVEIMGEHSVTRAFEERFRTLNHCCQEGCYKWQEEKEYKQTIGRYAHHWARKHNVRLDKRKLGGQLETDKHIITAGIVLGLEGEVSLVTHDRDLQESFQDILIEVIQGGGFQEFFPHQFTLYHSTQGKKVIR